MPHRPVVRSTVLTKLKGCPEQLGGRKPGIIIYRGIIYAKIGIGYVKHFIVFKQQGIIRIICPDLILINLELKEISRKPKG